MTEKMTSSTLAEELTCQLCNDFFHDPVSLGCRHNFCCACLTQLWTDKAESKCPVCERKSSRQEPPSMVNPILRNIVEAYLLERISGDSDEGKLEVCVRHKRRLRFYCKETEEMVCNVCVEKGHIGHSHVTVKEATAQLKTDLESVLMKLQIKMRQLEDMKNVSGHSAQHVKTQSHETAGEIKRQFAQLYQLLREEEQTKLAGLRMEEEQKLASLTERIRQLDEQIKPIAETIEEIKSRTMLDDFSFLQVSKTLKERAVETMNYPDPEETTQTLINVARHLANLQFNIWEKMQMLAEYTPVCFDENTSHPDLLISGSLREVRDGMASQGLPNNPERFDSMLGIFGFPGFQSGHHSWEVEMGCRHSWTIGVARESVVRKGIVNVNPKEGIWAIGLSNGKDYNAGTVDGGTRLQLQNTLERVLLRLDCDAHTVAFYDAKDMTLIHTFEGLSDEMIHPYFSPCLNTDGENPGTLKICPERVTVTRASALKLY